MNIIGSIIVNGLGILLAGTAAVCAAVMIPKAIEEGIESFKKQEKWTQN